MEAPDKGPENSQVQEVNILRLTPERAVDSPVRMTRSRRSISTSSITVESPSRNLRKRNVSPEVSKNSPPKTKITAPMTPTRKLRKNENTLFSTVDSPKPRKTRLSLAESTGTNPEPPLNLRRSRRLSTELNVVQEDPIKEAVVEPVFHSLPPKSRRGKRLSVMPSQPSLPEETEAIEVENKENLIRSPKIGVQASPLKCNNEAMEVINNGLDTSPVLEKSSNSIAQKSPNKTNLLETSVRIQKITHDSKENSFSKEEINSIEQHNESIKNHNRKSTTPKLSKEPSIQSTDDNQVTPNTSIRSNMSRKSTTPQTSEKPLGKSNEIDNQLTPNVSIKRSSIRKSATLKITEEPLGKSNDSDNQLTPNTSIRSNFSRKSGTPKILNESSANLNDSDNQLTPNTSTRMNSSRKSVTPKISLDVSVKSNDSGDQLTPSISTRMNSSRKSVTPKISLDVSVKSNDSGDQLTPSISTKMNSSRKSVTPKISLDVSVKSNDSGDELTPSISTRMNSSKKSVTSKISPEINDSDHQLTPNTSIRSNSSRKSAKEFFMDEKQKSLNISQESPLNNKSSAILNNSVSNKSKLSESLNNSNKSPTAFPTVVGDSERDLNTSVKNIKKSPNFKNPRKSLGVQKSDSENSPEKCSTMTSTPLLLNKLLDKKNICNDSDSSVEDNRLSIVSFSDEKDEESEADKDNNRKNLIDESASDAGMDYQSGDSMDEDEKDEMDENEIIEKGETLLSEDSPDAMNSDDSYEKDSFLVSSDEEDDALLSGSGDDLSSGEDLSQSKTSKEKFDKKQKKIQKRASREMFEARHSMDNSGKNNFSKSSDDSEIDDLKENEITKNSLSLSLAKKNNEDNSDSDSSDGEELEIVKRTFDEELLRLQNNMMDPSSDSESETNEPKSTKQRSNLSANSTPKVPVANENSKYNETIVENSSPVKVSKKKGLNKSDLTISTNKNANSKFNRSANLIEDSAVTIQESMQRLMNLNQSFSKVFTSLVNDMDRLKDNADLQVSNELSSSNVKSDSVHENSVRSTDRAQPEIEDVQQSKRKLSHSDGDEKKLKKSKKEEAKDISQRSSISDSLTAFEYYEKLKGGKTKSKSSRKNKKKSINEETQTSAPAESVSQKPTCELKSQGVRPILTTQTKNLVSTSQFQVREVNGNERAAVDCAGTSGKFFVTQVSRDNLLRNVSSGTLESTTAFAVACLKRRPKHEVRAANAPFVDFKTEMLYGAKVKRESSKEIAKKRQKLKASQGIKSRY